MPKSAVDPFWREAEPEALIHRLGGEPGLSAADARTVWKRAAGYRLSKPAVFLELSESLLNAVTRGNEHASEATSTEALGIAWCGYAEALNAAGRIKNAIPAFEQATRFAESAGDTDLLGRILVGRVHVLSLSGQGASASRLAVRAERLLRKTRNRVLLGKLLMNRGNAFYQSDRYREAFDTYARADRYLKTAAETDPARVGLLMNQAIVATQLDKLDAARAGFQNAEALAETLRLPFLHAYAQYNRAFLESLHGDYRTGLRLLEAAEQVFQEQSARDMSAATRRARGEFYLELGMPGPGEEFTRQAAGEFAAAGLELDAMLSRMHQARGLSLLDRDVEAIPLLEAALDYFTAVENRPRRAACLLSLAQSELAQGETAKARAYAGRALTTFRALDLSRWVVRAHVLRASALAAESRFSEVVKVLAEIRPRVLSLSVLERQEFWRVWGRAALALNRNREAKRYLERSAALLEQGRRMTPGIELRASSFARRSRVYSDLIELELQTGKPEFPRLFTWVERGRGRQFRDLAGRSRRGVTAPLTGKRALLGSLTRRLEEAEFDPGREQERNALKRRLGRLEREFLKEHRHIEELESGENKERVHGNAEAVRRKLSPHSSLVSFQILGDRVLALVLGRKESRHLVLPATTTEIQTRLDRVRFQFDTAILTSLQPGMNLDFLRRSAEDALRSLHEAVLAPLEPLLGRSEKLNIVPHGMLNHVPFECLFTADGYADDRWEITRLPLSEFLSRRRRSQKPVAEPLVAGTIRFGPKSVAAELKAVAAALPQGPGGVLRDPATQELLERLPRADLIHLSAHGVYREDNPMFSRISTADGALFLADVWQRRLRAKLVVLSACNSGRVFAGEGEDLAGVAQAFLAAGADSLVASLWRVHDAATAALMSAFYRHYQSGKNGGAAAALRSAGRDVRKQWDHPAFWRGFVSFGG